MLKDTLTAQLYKFYVNSKEGENIFTLHGNSMYPTLKTGWKVKIKPVNVKDINCGDIVIFSQKRLICHRIIEKFIWNKKFYFIHKGDADFLGSVIEENDTIGKVIEVRDTDGQVINEKLWRISFNSIINIRLKILKYIYPSLFITKRVLFGKKQNRLIRWIRKHFWYWYNIGLKEF